MKHPQGTPYINIGSEKACLFLHMSKFLMMNLTTRPKLYYAIEQALKTAEQGYFDSGVLAFSQLLNLFNQKTPDQRHVVAHEFLEQQQDEDTFNVILNKLKLVAEYRQEKEIRKHKLGRKKYFQDLHAEWESFHAAHSAESTL